VLTTYQRNIQRLLEGVAKVMFRERES